MRIGMQIGASTPPAELPGIARLAEELGYGEIWLAEDYFELGGIASVATALAATERIPIGLGVAGAGVRHPGVTAMEFATLAGTYPGRFMGGLGHGSPSWMRQMGLIPESPTTLLREATRTVRRLLDGDTVTEKGDYFELDDISLDHPPSTKVPLYFGVQGPASLRLAGELADGTLLGWLSSPGSVQWARRHIDEGRERAGRSDPHEVAVLCLLSVSDDDPDRARRSIARWGSSMLSSMAGSRPLESAPEGEELRALAAETGKEGIGDAISPELLGRFAAAGSSEDCAATVTALLDAGADRVVLVPNPAGFRTTGEMVLQMKRAQRLIG